MTKKLSDVASDGTNLPRLKKKVKEDSAIYTAQKTLMTQGLGYLISRPCEQIIQEYGKPPYKENTSHLH